MISIYDVNYLLDGNAFAQTQHKMTGCFKLLQTLSCRIIISDTKLKKCLDRFFDLQSNRRRRLLCLPKFSRKFTEINSFDVNCVC